MNADSRHLLARLSQATLDPNSGVPLYLQIREVLRHCIADESCVELGGRLPAETDLAAVFGVSRMTVRRALADLAGDGMLRRLHGLGTLVVSRKVVRNYNRLSSFFEDTQRMGLSPSSRLLARAVVRAPEHIAPALKVDPGSPLIHLRRLRYTEGQLVAIHEVYVSKALCPWLMDEDLENQSLYQLYEAHGLRLEWGSQRIEATAATPEQAQLLGCKPGWPLLYLERITYATGDLPVEWVQSYSPAGAYSLEMTLRR